MRLRRSQPFLKEYTKLPLAIRKKVDRQIGRLASDSHHPSLYTKKMKGRENMWEARVDIHHRMTFQITADLIVLRRVGAHDILKKP